MIRQNGIPHVITTLLNYYRNTSENEEKYTMSLMPKQSCMFFFFLVIVVVPELLLEFVDNVLVHLESLGENICVDRRVGPEHGVGDGDDSRVLAAKSGESHRRSVTGVELKVDETDREHEHVTFLELLREELVFGALDVRGHEAHQELSLGHHQDF